MKNELSFFWNDWASNRELIWLSASTSSSYYRCYLPYIWIITEDLSEFVTTYCFLTIHPRRGEGPIGKLCLPGEGGIRDLFSEILPVILQSFNFQNGGGGTSNPLYSSSHQPSLYTSYITAYYYILKYTNVLKVKS